MGPLCWPPNLRHSVVLSGVPAVLLRCSLSVCVKRC